MIAWAVDTGITRNASALGRVELVGSVWHAWAWQWQGSQGRPLSIEHTVGPGARALYERLGKGKLAADGYYAPELKRGLGPKIHVRIQGGDLVNIYAPTRNLVHGWAKHTLRVQAIGWAWDGRQWQEDTRTGERVIAGFKAVEAEHVGGKLVVSLPEAGASHHDEAVAIMRALWHASAGVIGQAPLDHRGPFASHSADGWTKDPAPSEDRLTTGWEPTFV